MTEAVRVSRGDVLLLLGTRKGAFVLSSDSSRKDWSLSGPHWAGIDVFHAAYDPRDGAIFAAINSLCAWAEVEGPDPAPNAGAMAARIRRAVSA